MGADLFSAEPVWNDDVVVVTGGTRGIGRSITRAFIERGATVVAIYYSNDEAATTTEELLADEAGDVHTRQLDIRDYDGVETAFEEIRQDHGPVSVLVNNASIIQHEWLPRMDAESWTRDVETNLLGTMNCTERAVSSMIANGGGSIINISSVAGQQSWIGQSSYSASKAGIDGFTRAAARDLAQLGIRVNTVSPGLTNTGHYQSLKNKDIISAEDEKQIPLERVGDPDEIADCVLFLASSHASYITGEVLRVDGGLLS